ncbi:hypothetical protein [Fontivita pretiosa]|uniref:hypothetical protein n=1 Tax=Fontivita pretiosa TaxID=2989684 RepID=UPI003D16C794
MPTLWENFALFAPADAIAAIYEQFQFESPGPAIDLCWSYEFNLGHQDRQLDIVMHVRFADRDEIIIGEAKAGRKPFDDKDLAPRDVIGRDVFRFAGVRRYFLLGDAPVPHDWHRHGYRHLTWRRLCEIQSALCQTLPESPEVRELVRRLIGAQFAGHGIAADLPSNDISIDDIQREAQAVIPGVTTERCRQFIACAIQHIRCLRGLPSDSVPIPYLAAEPTVEQIKRRWRLGCGTRAVNEKAYWKLPPRRA